MIGLIAAAMVTAQAPAGIPQLMPVFGISAGDRGVTVQLAPAGCNPTKSDFTIAISKSADRPTILIARRNRANPLVLCKGQPASVDITWSYADLGLSSGQPFSVANPLVGAP
jgi:hypothetical protein